MNQILAQEDIALQQKMKVNLRKVTVLIVDPNEFARTFIRSICRNLNFGNILTTGNTNEAFDLLRTNRVQLIVCDWALTPLSSIDFVRQLRWAQDILDNGVPVIILTSTGSSEAIVAARDAGVDDYLTRPIVMRRLLTSFVSVLCSKRVYIRSPNYIGPCRRRRRMPFSGPERRAGWPSKSGDSATFVVAAPPSELSRMAQAPSGSVVLSKGNENVSVMPPSEIAATEDPGGAANGEVLSDASLDEMEKAGEAAIAQEADNYSKVRLDDIAEIFELVRQMKQPSTQMKEVLDRIYTKGMDVKGMGNTFGYPLLTRVGDLLCNFVQKSDPESFRVLAKLQVVETHAIIMKMIVDSNMHDEKDPLAEELIAELEVMVSKFTGAKAG